MEEKTKEKSKSKGEKLGEEKQRKKEKTDLPEFFETKYDALELASRLARKYRLRSDLVLVALSDGQMYTVKEAESLIFALKKRKVN
ncbi:MAG: hypothetical protein R3Y63_04150 [Eubacteriales bacterium]